MANAQISPFEKNKGLTATYQELIDYYQVLDEKHGQMQILDCGQSDIGKPINLIVLSRTKSLIPSKSESKTKLFY